MNIMKAHLILITPGWLLLGAVTSHAGSSSGGTGAGAVVIPADTLSSGGGISSAGSGASTIVVTASMGGVIGASTAASPTITNRQGYIPQILPPQLYELWAAQNIPAGRDASFTGDWNRDGVSNAVDYVFGTTRIQPVGGQVQGTARIPAPPSIPADVNVFLDSSELSLANWQAIVSWVGGAPALYAFPAFTSITGGHVVDSGNNSPFFYRYRITRR